MLLLSKKRAVTLLATVGGDYIAYSLAHIKWAINRCWWCMCNCIAALYKSTGFQRKKSVTWNADAAFRTGLKKYVCVAKTCVPTSSVSIAIDNI